MTSLTRAFHSNRTGRLNQTGRLSRLAMFVVLATGSPIANVRSDTPDPPGELSELSSIRDLCYVDDRGGDPAETRVGDFRLPERSDDAPAASPVVVVVHGGGWRSGDKRNMAGHAAALRRAGFATFNINYRLAPEHPFPAAVDDVRSAVLYLADHAETLSIDPKRIGMFGYSAGAHLVLLAAMTADADAESRCRTSHWPDDDPRWKRLPRPVAVVAGGTPSDFRNLRGGNRSMAYFFGGTPDEVPQRYTAGSLPTHASSGDPPTLLIHGTSDVIVQHSQAQRLLETLRDANVSARLVSLPSFGHLLTFLSADAKAEMVAFFRRRLRPL